MSLCMASHRPPPEYRGGGAATMWSRTASNRACSLVGQLFDRALRQPSSMVQTLAGRLQRGELKHDLVRALAEAPQPGRGIFSLADRAKQSLNLGIGPLGVPRANDELNATALSLESRTIDQSPGPSDCYVLGSPEQPQALRR
jgi:hypothetical protein